MASLVRVRCPDGCGQVLLVPREGGYVFCATCRRVVLVLPDPP